MSARKVLLIRTRRTDGTASGAPEIVSWYSDTAVPPAPPGTVLDGFGLGGQVIEDRVLASPTLVREIAGDIASLSAGSGVGILTLANADGALDGTRAHVWRDIRVWLWDQSTSVSTAFFLFAADCGRGEHVISNKQPKRVTIPLADAMGRLDRPLTPTNYAGTNNGTTNLYEGDSGGIAGQPKPWQVGDLDLATGAIDGPLAHLPAVIVNGARRTYQLHNGPVDLIEVFDRGAPSGLAFDGDYVGSAFDARVLPSASFCTDLARGLVKITDGLVGQVSFGARRATPLPVPYGSVTEAVAPGRAIGDILTLAALSGGAKGVIIFDALQLRNALGPIGPTGWWYADVTSVREAVAPFARAGGGVLAARRDGSFFCAAIKPAKAVADITLDALNIINLEVAETAGAPVGEVRLGWGRLWATFDNQELAPSLRSSADAARLSTSWRWAVARDTNTIERAVDWRSVTIETALRSRSIADTIAGQLLSAFGLRADGQARRSWTVTLEVSAALLARDLGDTVRLMVPSQMIDERLILVGERLCSPRAGLVEWTLWG